MKKIVKRVKSRIVKQVTESNKEYAEKLHKEIHNHKHIIEIPTLMDDFNSYRNKQSIEIFMKHCH
jgi:hypothetical protein